MRRRKQRVLDAEERILWHSIARTVVPLKGKALDAEVEPISRLPKQDEKKPPRPRPPTPSALRPGRIPDRQQLPAGRPDRAALDRPTQAKIAKGRLGIDASIDLHGLTQAEAHDLLLSFLHRASASGKRHVLVVTGKGFSAGGEGILRRAVPGWFATAAFRALVSGFGEAARHHGGGGALYVRLRKASVR